MADYGTAIRIDPKYVDGYNDRANAWFGRREYERAIADYTEALRLDPKYALAFRNRGLAWKAKGDLDRAIADYGEAIRLDPNYALAYGNRGTAFRDKGDYDRAIADLTEAVRVDPKYEFAHRNRGFAHYLKGDFASAAADFQRSTELKDDAYPMLFCYLARTRAGENAARELETNAARLKGQSWPETIVGFYLDKTSMDAVLAAAGRPEQRCEAQFYVGQWHIVRGNRAEAAAALKTATDICPKDFIEYALAAADLKRLEP